MANIERGEHDQSVPRIIDPKPAPSWYGGESEYESDSTEQIMLAEGAHPFDPPMDPKTNKPLIDTFINSDNLTYLAIRPYHTPDMRMADSYIRARFNIGPTPVIDYRDRSLDILEDIVMMFNHQRKTLIVSGGPCFPGVKNAVNRFHTEGKTDYPMRFIPISPSLNDTAEKKVEDIINFVSQNRVPGAVIHEPVSNPTGQITQLESVEKLAEECARKGWLLVEDEAYGDSMDDENSAIHLVERFPATLMVVKSFSKIAKFRGGFVVMGAHIKDRWERVKDPYLPSPLAELLINHMSDPEIIVPYAQDIRGLVRKNKKRLVEGLRAAGLVVPDTSYDVPISLVGGARLSVADRPTKFYANMEHMDIKVAEGAGYAGTYLTKEGDGMDNGWVRMTVPRNSRQIPTIISRAKAAWNNTFLTRQNENN